MIGHYCKLRSLCSSTLRSANAARPVDALVKIGLTLAAATALVIIQPRISSATSLNVDFADASLTGAPSADYGANANQAGTWNEITTTGPTNLVGLNGASLPGVTLNLSISSTLGSGFTGTSGFVFPNYSLSPNDQALVADYFYTILGSWTVTLSGLQNGSYNLYVYSSANGSTQTSSYSVNGVTEANLNGNIDDNGYPPVVGPSYTLEEGVNYAIDSVLISDGTLTIASGSLPDGILSSGLAGFQLAPALAATPIPAALPLFATGLAGLGWLARRKRKRTA